MNCISKQGLLGDENCNLCYKSIINYDLDITNILVVSPQIRYIEVFDITNPPFNEQIWLSPGTSLNRGFTVERQYIQVLNSFVLHFYRGKLKVHATASNKECNILKAQQYSYLSVCSCSLLCMISFHSSDSAHLGVPTGGSLSTGSPFRAFVLFHLLFVAFSAFSLRLSSLRQ